MKHRQTSTTRPHQMPRLYGYAISRKIVFLFALLSALSSLEAAEKRDSIAQRLNVVFDNKELYIANKEQKIESLRQLLSISELSLDQKYDLNKKLFFEFEKFQSDSAIGYVRKNSAIADRLGDSEKQQETQLQLAALYTTIGSYVEAKQILSRFDSKTLSQNLRCYYYETYVNFYSNYGQSNDNFNNDYKTSEIYRDSLLAILDTTSLQYQISLATKLAYHGNKKEAEARLLALLATTTDENPNRAEIAYLLGIIYSEEGKPELVERYYSISAITDIVNAIRDNASLQGLALTYYEKGDIDRAFRFMEAATNDAITCNVKYRSTEGSLRFPIINTAYQEKEKQQKSELKVTLILISILTLLLIMGIVYVYMQMRRVSRIRKELYRTNVKLNESNADLHTANLYLYEANRIKEEYIAHFFGIYSTYIDKFEEYRKMLNKSAANKNPEELYRLLKSTTIIENEIEELYKNFDSIFLNLYPTFVEDFNALLMPEEQIHPKQGELLNTELRIFALIRLGITDSVKIASFLRYSLRTVYNYRTKVRNKSAVVRDEFENEVKKIGLITDAPTSK